MTPTAPRIFQGLVGKQHFPGKYHHVRRYVAKLKKTWRLASDAFVSRILFPVDGVRSLTSSDRVCQLRWANKKSRT